HRDLKPSNILLAPPADEPALNTAWGCPRITDFGLAKRLGEPGRQTASGTVMGTLAYMAPEQAAARGEEVGPAADVYALGVILHQLLTGTVPFKAEGWLETLRMVAETPPAPVRQSRPEAPAALEAICLRCLAKRPAERFASAQALAEELARCLN